jgi:hypothetical protein
VTYPRDNLAYLRHESLQRFFVTFYQFFSDFLNHRPGNERKAGHGSAIVILGYEVMKRPDHIFEPLNNGRFNRPG